jgi:hypothetical protein
MVDPRLAAEGDALTTASVLWRFVDGRSGSEWGILLSAAADHDHQWAFLVRDDGGFELLKFSAASSEKAEGPHQKNEPTPSFTLRGPT